MLPPLKLNSIDAEHLQELYDASGVARDELPYTEAYEVLWQGFQDRTFKNAEREQLFGAMLKYTRSSSNSAGELPATKLTDDQVKLLKQTAARYSRAGKLLPYSDELASALREFNKLAQVELTQTEFWQAVVRVQGAKRRPPPRKKAVVAAVAADDGDEDGE
jgi:hypothetical protein